MMITDPYMFNSMSQSMAIFSVALDEIMENAPNVKILSSDMSARVGLDRIKVFYPNSFINVGIAEQNLIGFSAGLSSEGWSCVAVAQASFISMRCYEQVRQYLSYMGNPVILVGYNAGFMLQQMGNTHYAIEDLAIMRVLPNITVLSPANSFEAYKMFHSCMELRRPVYIRLTGNVDGYDIYKEDYHFEIGKNVVLREGSDICIYATGSMVSRALVVAELLSVTGCSARVVNVHTIKPFDCESVICQKDKKLLVSIEEHSIIGGLGTTIADVLADGGYSVPLLKLGIQDTFSIPGSYEFLLERHRLTAEKITEDILKRLK